MRLEKTNRRQTIDLSSLRHRSLGSSRDRTRLARARWAELSLKMHTREKGERSSDPSNAQRAAQDDEINREF